MSASLELGLRRLLRRLLAAFGTPAAALALLTLAAAYLAGAALWERYGAVEVGRALPGSFAFWGLGVLLLVDSGVGLRAAVPVALGSSGTLEVRRVDRRTLGSLLLRAAYAAASLAFVLSLAGQDRVAFRLAEGEAYDEAGSQLVDRAPPRPLSRGPFPFPFTLGAAGPGPSPVAELVRSDASRVRASAWWPRWEGWDRFVRPVEKGLVLRYAISRVGGGPAIEDAFVKLDLLGAGKRDAIRLGAVPHRLVLTIPEGTAVRDGFVPPLRVQAARGKRLVADEVIAPGQALRFEGLTLRFLEARSWIAFGMIRDPGIPLALAAAALALAGLVAWAGAGRAGPRRGTTAPLPVPRSAP